MKALIMAGGTGGHIFPAAAVAETLVAKGHEVRWLGAARGMEAKLVPSMRYPLDLLPVSALQGGWKRKVTAPINLLRAVFYCRRLFKQHKPDVVIGFGGYASAPGGVYALLSRVPLVLHEQNAVAGVTNKWLHKYAKVVLAAFPGTFAGEVETVGNPVRQPLLSVPAPSQRPLGDHAALRILVLGGSQGAAAINDAVPGAIAALNLNKQVEVWHQAGAGKVDATLSAYQTAGIESSTVEFITDMAKAYRWADVVIARSGASTVSEIAAVGLYSLLIPYPWHKDQQQFKNAQWLANGDAATIIEQKDLTAELLGKAISSLANNRKKIKVGAEKAYQLGIRDSAQRIVSRIEKDITGKAA